MRIIPARAGFTTRRRYFRQRRWDHPRSRGVYLRMKRQLGPESGSSPLARGLLLAGQRRRERRGIIPARAGFTVPGTPPRSAGRDHPRSRGVYPDVIFTAQGMTGSSPLARGLHRGPTERQEWPGIIPARAGFTPPRRAAGHPCADHPRSRGVYVTKVKDENGLLGSSPLARGLRGPAEPAASADRIIPARAGFTHRDSGSGEYRTDHPRSRGVYGSPPPP